MFELPDGSQCSYKSGTTFGSIVQDLQSKYTSSIVAVKINNEIRELYYVPQSGGKLNPIDLSQEDGTRIYSRSLILVMLRAANELFPGCQIRFEHSLSKGIYGEVYLQESQPFTAKELREITTRMYDIHPGG